MFSDMRSFVVCQWGTKLVHVVEEWALIRLNLQEIEPKVRGGGGGGGGGVRAGVLFQGWVLFHKTMVFVYVMIQWSN